VILLPDRRFLTHLHTELLY